jgi:acetyl esterase
VSSLTGLKRADGQRVSLGLGALLGASTLAVSFAAKHPSALVNRILDVVFPIVGGPRAKDVAMEELDVGGLPARLYTPEGGSDRLLVFFHGGGFVIGSLKTHGVTAAFTAKHAGCKVLAVAYRKAPQHRFPTALEDCTAAYRWAVANADRLGVEPDRIAVGGDSAGGQLAAAVCLELDAGETRPAFAWLIYPLVDADVSKYDSAWLFERGPLLTRRNAHDMVNHYAPTVGELTDPRLTILVADGLDRLPPTYVATAGMDPIRDQGEAFARAARAAGVPVEARRFHNLPHGFDLLLIEPSARAATIEACHALARGFGSA